MDDAELVARATFSSPTKETFGSSLGPKTVLAPAWGLHGSELRWVAIGLICHEDRSFR